MEQSDIFVCILKSTADRWVIINFIGLICSKTSPYDYVEHLHTELWAVYGLELEHTGAAL